MTDERAPRIHATGQEIEVAYHVDDVRAVGGIGLVVGLVLLLLAVLTSGVAALVCGLLALAGLAVVAGAVGTLLRGPRVLLTADGLDYRGWAVDAYVAWDDIEGTAIDRRVELRPLAEVLVRPDAASLRRRSALLALPEPMGARPRILLLARGLDEPWLLLDYVEEMRRLGREERASRLGSSGLAFLRGRRDVGYN